MPYKLSFPKKQTKPLKNTEKRLFEPLSVTVQVFTERNSKQTLTVYHIHRAPLFWFSISYAKELFAFFIKSYRASLPELHSQMFFVTYGKHFCLVKES